MPKGSIPENLARDAAARIEAARDAGQQLTFLPDEPGAAAAGARPPRGKGKITSMLRDHLAARGYRMPEDVLAEMAGLSSREDVFLTALARTEQVLAWAQSGGRDIVEIIRDGMLIQHELDNTPTTGQRLATFQFVFTAMLRAADALIPYGLGKITPDVAPQAPVTIVMPGAQVPTSGPETARDVTPRPGRMAPPPMPGQVEQNQGLIGSDAAHSDGGIRTEGPRA
jgi:hypothetical protein